MSTTVKSLYVSPWRRGSRSWSAPPWAASWCHQSSSSPPAGSSGCHCRLRRLMLAAACNCPESTELPHREMIRHLLLHRAVPDAEIWEETQTAGVRCYSAPSMSWCSVEHSIILTADEVGQGGVKVVWHQLLWLLTGQLARTSESGFQDAPSNIWRDIRMINTQQLINRELSSILIIRMTCW